MSEFMQLFFLEIIIGRRRRFGRPNAVGDEHARGGPAGCLGVLFWVRESAGRNMM